MLGGGDAGEGGGESGGGVVEGAADGGGVECMVGLSGAEEFGDEIEEVVVDVGGGEGADSVGVVLAGVVGVGAGGVEVLLADAGGGVDGELEGEEVDEALAGGSDEEGAAEGAEEEAELVLGVAEGREAGVEIAEVDQVGAGADGDGGDPRLTRGGIGGRVRGRSGDATHSRRGHAIHAHGRCVLCN